MANALAAGESVPASAPTSLRGLGRRFAAAVSLKSANRALYVLATLVALYFVLVLLGGMVKLSGVSGHIRKLEISGAKAASASADPAKFEPGRIDPMLGNRNAFQPAGAQSVSTGDGASNISSSAVYRLVGISESKDLAENYVMVENTQAKLTYFLQYGQPVEGLELDKILEDRVIVKIGGDPVELK